MVEKETSFSEGIFWIALGGLICILALQFDLGTFRGPGPGFVAFLVGTFMVVIGAIMVTSRGLSRRRPKTGDEGQSKGLFASMYGRLAYTMVLLVGYAVLMDPLGFIVSTCLVMMGLFFDWQKRNWFWSAFFAVVTTLANYLVFETWLRCQLPRGILPWW